MKEPVAQSALELDLADFGPIIEAKVDLRPLTVFVGPSNTGKSYLAILIYALHQAFSGDGYLTGTRFRRRLPLVLRRGNQDLSEEGVDALLNMARFLAANPKVLDQGNLVLPPPVARALQTGLDCLADALSRQIGRCFGVEESGALIRKGRANVSRVIIRRRSFDRADTLEQRFSLARVPEFRSTVPAEVPIPVEPEAGNRTWPFVFGGMLPPDAGEEDASHRKSIALEFLSWLGDIVLPSLFGPLHMPAFYLPSDRTGVMHAHSVVVSALIASAPAAGLRPAARPPMLSGVLADFLEQLIGIGQTERARRKSEPDLGGDIEKLILGGSVRIDRSSQIDYPHFAYRPHGWKDDLALANASSMVSELAPVVLYLRHRIGHGNVLIVEEPESHLHPAMQVELTRQLAALVTAGVRIIVTTHSEWLLEELANIVRRSELPVSERGEQVALSPCQVGAWLFEPKKRPKGSVVKEIRLDDSGLYPSGYDDIARALHNDWSYISSRVGAGS